MAKIRKMRRNKFIKYSWISIILLLVVIPVININHKLWNVDAGVIQWDVKQYYAYLPATFIEHDLSLSYYDEDPDFYSKWLWTVKTEKGKRAIVTSMGLSVLYSPFFLASHVYAGISPKYEQNGYSVPYHVGLVISSWFYFILGLIFLRKGLLRFFSEKVTAITILLVGLATNLLFYVTHKAPMPHAYNFALIAIFFYLLMIWHERKTIKSTILLGLIAGLFTLIRPTNIIVLLAIPLYGVRRFNDLKTNLTTIFSRWKLLLLMIGSFVLIWIPQFLYWKYVFGRFFYFSYGDVGGTFFFDNPQIIKFLFGYGKGWFVYTPVMLLAFVGFVFLWKNFRQLFWPAISVVLIAIYVLSSWWCWWFGGSFGQRSMIDFYALLAFPLAALLQYFSAKKLWIQIAGIVLLLSLTAFNLFQIRQYNNKAIHYWLMNKEAYWENFLLSYPSEKYWHIITTPHYQKAQEGIYVRKPNRTKKVAISESELVDFIVEEKQIPFYDSLSSYKCQKEVDSLLNVYASELVENKEAEPYFDRLKIRKYKANIMSSRRWKRQLESKAKKSGVDFEDMVENEAQRVYRMYGQKYH